ncbi:protein bicaudal C homolog 1-B-like isoform X2 [Ctenopharyngodon idella]|uniref:protein bicaudal C homolog 1-B-like isoform X2 n=1 Tax=Ctenopharyngodon idella TaxID=7959 RepID=UPI00222F9970|nr:protein bicaudal C homolog 1-B-like isoform X2 [Ctenopharyngodon idella]
MDIRDHLDHRSLDLSFLRFHWSHPDQQHSTQPAMQNLFGASRSGDSLQQLAFQAHESLRGADPMDRFCSLLPALESPSGSSSLVNTEKSAISVGFDHLVSLRASTPSPPALPELQAEGVKLDEVAHWKQNPLSIFTNAPSAQAEGPVVGCCSTGPIWPGSDAFGLNKPSFYIEREAKRHKRAAANESELKQTHSVASCTVSSGRLLQRTKNSLIHAERMLDNSDCENSLADKRAPGKAAERRLGPHMQAFDYEKKQLLATIALPKQPVVTEIRTPTNSGLGFSKSKPADSMKELRRAHYVPYEPSMSTSYENTHLSVSHSGSQEGLGEQYLSSSNYMDSISMSGSNGCSLSSSLKRKDLPELFSKLGLSKYTDIFQQQEIDLQIFVTLTDPDLKELGITAFGARRKMLLAISELNKSRKKFFDSPNIRSSFLEGRASGCLSSQFH